MDSFTSIISPKSLGTPKSFEFETQETQDYIDSLEENLNNHVKLIKNIILKMQGDSSEDTLSEISSPAQLEKLLSSILELYNSLGAVHNERKVEISKILLSELVEHEHTGKCHEITAEFEERIHEIKFHIDLKDKMISDLQRINSELESIITYAQNFREIMVVSLDKEILEVHTHTEYIRDSVSDICDRLNFGYNYKQLLIDAYKKVWQRAQIIQALLRNPVNIKDGIGRKNIRLKIEDEEPELTIEFDGSDTDEPTHCRAFTLQNESFGKSGHNRHTLSSGRELISAVKSSLNLKIERSERKLSLLKSEYQNLAEDLYAEGQDNFKLLQENLRLAKEYKDGIRKTLNIRNSKIQPVGKRSLSIL